MLESVEKVKAYENITNQIKKLIQNGELKAGDKLPNENTLSKIFKVSRATVREAIRSLESKGIIQSIHGKGHYITTEPNNDLINIFANSILIEKEELEDLFYIRKSIEPYIAEFAAKNATEEDLVKMEKIITEQEKNLSNFSYSSASDMSFHNLLFKMANKRILENLLNEIVKLFAKARRQHLASKERTVQSISGHKEIYNAIKCKDSVRANKAMRNHLETVESLLFK
jgi:GntR family transcriptional repressor for pyruvate dehydrogenase complex